MSTALEGPRARLSQMTSRPPSPAAVSRARPPRSHERLGQVAGLRALVHLPNEVSPDVGGRGENGYGFISWTLPEASEATQDSAVEIHESSVTNDTWRGLAHASRAALRDSWECLGKSSLPAPQSRLGLAAPKTILGPSVAAGVTAAAPVVVGVHGAMLDAHESSVQSGGSVSPP
jgi:hypothetical protein